MRRTWILAVIVLLLGAGAGVAVFRSSRRGFSARERPSALEAFIARRVRQMATPASAREAKNPFSGTPEIIEQAREHFADHCASCHGNDGSGQTEIGKNLYPKPPDMRLPATQNLSDGEIYFIIHNGIRLTGMPAWGAAGQNDDTWKLVLFIRHLPTMTSEEMNKMGHWNPKSDAEREEEKQEEEFLKGRNPPTKAKEHNH